MVKVIGDRNQNARPGLKRHLLNPDVAAPSRMGDPVLCRIRVEMTFPALSTRITTTPLPVILLWRAISGYSGRGEKTASLSASLSGISPGSIGRANNENAHDAHKRVARQIGRERIGNMGGMRG